MRRAARIDSNQPAIVKALRDIGTSIQHLHQLGQGAPDLLVGYGGANWLFEVKDADKPPSARKLTQDEADWHAGWKGIVYVVETAAQALQIIRGGV